MDLIKRDYMKESLLIEKIIQLLLIELMQITGFQNHSLDKEICFMSIRRMLRLFLMDQLNRADFHSLDTVFGFIKFKNHGLFFGLVLVLLPTKELPLDNLY